MLLLAQHLRTLGPIATNHYVIVWYDFRTILEVHSNNDDDIYQSYTHTGFYSPKCGTLYLVMVDHLATERRQIRYVFNSSVLQVQVLQIVLVVVQYWVNH